MLGQTEIVLLVLVAAVVVIFFIWRSRQNVRSEKKTAKLREAYPIPDVLVKNEEAREKTEPTLAAADEAESDSASPAPASKPLQSAQPSDTPPFYDEFEKEAERRAAEEAKKAESEPVAVLKTAEGRAEPDVDQALEWVLDITAPESTVFKMGSLDSLRRELHALNLKLPLSVWTRNADDQLYYECDRLQKSADRVVVAVVLTNRRVALDEVTASSVLQVMETVATQYDITVRLSIEIPQAVETARNLQRFVQYYDKPLEMEILPSDPESDFTLDAVAKLAAASGFEQNRGGFEYRIGPESLSPEITLSLQASERRGLRLSLDLPLVQAARGDLLRFFQLANHFCGHLHATLADCNGHPIGTGEALFYEDAAKERMLAMKKSGVTPGSERARLLFSTLG